MNETLQRKYRNSPETSCSQLIQNCFLRYPGRRELNFMLEVHKEGASSLREAVVDFCQYNNLPAIVSIVDMGHPALGAVGEQYLRRALKEKGLESALLHYQMLKEWRFREGKGVLGNIHYQAESENYQALKNFQRSLYEYI